MSISLQFNGNCSQEIPCTNVNGDMYEYPDNFHCMHAYIHAFMPALVQSGRKLLVRLFRD